MADRIFEDDLALAFAPTFISSAGEDRYLAELERRLDPRIALAYPPWKPCIYYSVFHHGQVDGQDFYEINYLSIWDRDTGGILGKFSAHIWDIERTVALVKGLAGDTDPSSFEVEEIYFAAHEGESINLSTYLRPRERKNGTTVYWTLGKHASYSEYPASFLSLFDQFKQPEEKADASDYRLVNAGRVGMSTDLAPWIEYKEPWGPDWVSPVYSKLKKTVWSPLPGSSRWIQNRPGTIKSQADIERIQVALGVQPTGVVDFDFFAEARTLSPELTRNASRMDDDLLESVVSLKPKKLIPERVIAAPREVTLEAVISPKDVEGSRGARAVNLGQIGSDRVLYGLIPPDDERISEVSAAPIETIAKKRIAQGDMRIIINS